MLIEIITITRDEHNREIKSEPYFVSPLSVIDTDKIVVNNNMEEVRSNMIIRLNNSSVVSRYDKVKVEGKEYDIISYSIVRDLAQNIRGYILTI